MDLSQQLTLGIIPPPIFPSSTIFLTPLMSTSFTKLAGSSRLAKIPGTSVSRISFSTPSAAATSPATVSALMLYDCPVSSAATDAITGMWLLSNKGQRMAGSTLLTSPTNPSWAAFGFGRAMNRWPSKPDTPTAVASALLIKDTKFLLTFPTKTIFTISMVDASVTRRPSRPDFIAAPPYLITIILPRNFWMNGRDSARMSTQVCAAVVARYRFTAPSIASHPGADPKRDARRDEATSTMIQVYEPLPARAGNFSKRLYPVPE
uniref:Uncharacterized protein n=1 Tax=Kalanchoe fedtschenkoi TaxID=63787 RepID=A0A7N0VKN9_KALFE